MSLFIEQLRLHHGLLTNLSFMKSHFFPEKVLFVIGQVPSSSWTPTAHHFPPPPPVPWRSCPAPPSSPPSRSSRRWRTLGRWKRTRTRRRRSTRRETRSGTALCQDDVQPLLRLCWSVSPCYQAVSLLSAPVGRFCQALSLPSSPASWASARPPPSCSWLPGS